MLHSSTTMLMACGGVITNGLHMEKAPGALLEKKGALLKPPIVTVEDRLKAALLRTQTGVLTPGMIQTGKCVCVADNCNWNLTVRGKSKTVKEYCDGRGSESDCTEKVGDWKFSSPCQWNKRLASRWTPWQEAHGWNPRMTLPKYIGMHTSNENAETLLSYARRHKANLNGFRMGSRSDYDGKNKFSKVPDGFNGLLALPMQPSTLFNISLSVLPSLPFSLSPTEEPKFIHFFDLERCDLLLYGRNDINVHSSHLFYSDFAVKYKDGDWKYEDKYTCDYNVANRYHRFNETFLRDNVERVKQWFNDDEKWYNREWRNGNARSIWEGLHEAGFRKRMEQDGRTPELWEEVYGHGMPNKVISMRDLIEENERALKENKKNQFGKPLGYVIPETTIVQQVGKPLDGAEKKQILEILNQQPTGNKKVKAFVNELVAHCGTHAYVGDLPWEFYSKSSQFLNTKS